MELRLILPTYNGNLYADEVYDGGLPEFGAPLAPLVARNAEGLRIVLGTHDLDDLSKPEIQIERQPNAWAIILHPLGGHDPCGCIYLLNDGRAVLHKEQWLGADSILVLEADEPLPEVYGSP